MKRVLTITMKSVAALMLLSFLMGANCVTSGNVIILQDIPDFDAQTESNITAHEIDLGENEDWQDQREDIISIDDIGFACRIHNNGAAVASGQLYLSVAKEETSVEGIKENAVLLLDGIAVNPGETREIEWGESHGFIKNFNEAKAVVFNKTEIFWVYFIAAETPFNISVNDVVLIMSINGTP